MPDAEAPRIERPIWLRAVAKAWRADMKAASDPPTARLLRVESHKGDVVSSGKFAGVGCPDDHWRCINAAPAVRWMRGLRWKDARAHLSGNKFSWQWL